MNELQAVEAQSFNDIQPPEDFHKQYPHIPVGTIKWDMHERHNNGAQEAFCFIKIGKRFCVVVPRYLDWKLSKAA